MGATMRAPKNKYCVTVFKALNQIYPVYFKERYRNDSNYTVVLASLDRIMNIYDEPIFNYDIAEPHTWDGDCYERIKKSILDSSESNMLEMPIFHISEIKFTRRKWFFENELIHRLKIHWLNGRHRTAMLFHLGGRVIPVQVECAHAELLKYHLGI